MMSTHENHHSGKRGLIKVENISGKLLSYKMFPDSLEIKKDNGLWDKATSEDAAFVTNRLIKAASRKIEDSGLAEEAVKAFQWKLQEINQGKRDQ